VGRSWRVLAVAAGLVITACSGSGGGGGSIDEAALRARIAERSPGATQDVIDVTVDVVRNACEHGDRRTMAQLRSEDPDGYALARFACPRAAATATETTG
jgi:hypothetical protein